MINLLIFRELAAQLTLSSKPGQVVTNIINPGFVRTTIMRNANDEGRLYNLYISVMKKTFSRTPEQGGRTLVNAAQGGEHTHGQYLDDCRIGR